MEKQRIKKIFQNININNIVIRNRTQNHNDDKQLPNMKKPVFGPKRKVCRKLEFSTPPPRPSVTIDCSLECSNKDLEERFESLSVDGDTSLFSSETLQSTTADPIAFETNNDGKSMQTFNPIISEKDPITDESFQEKSAKVVILSNILLPKYDLKKKKDINTFPVQELIPLLPQSFKPDKTPSESKSEDDNSNVPALATTNLTPPETACQNQVPCTSATTTSVNKTSTKESLICKIDLNRLSSLQNKLQTFDPPYINDSSESNTSDSSLNNKKSINEIPKTSKKPLRTNIKSYQISPVNSDESDPDLSDSDPTYHAGMENIGKKIPSLLLSRQSRNLFSSSSSSDSDVDNSISPIKKTRKRKRDPSSWKFNTAKRLRNAGQSYVSAKTNKTIGGRSMKPPCNEKCRLQCSQKICEEERKLFFNKFWSLNSLDIQREFIRNCMVEVKPRYRYSNTENPRKSNYAFYLKHGDKNERICKTFFTTTLDISDRMIRTVKEKCDKQNFLGEDKRGKHGNHKRLDATLVNDIQSFIASIPRVESHYIRATSTCEYISPGRTLTEIYQDFVEFQQQNGRLPGKFCNFYDIFKDTGIKIHQPKKDLCDLCRDYKLTSNENLKDEYEKHIEEKELSRKEKKEDRYAIDENNICAVYDLEAILPAPNGRSSSLYYKTKMNCYNFTIAELAKKNHSEEESNKAYTNVYSYFWDETQGQKGSVEIATCVLKFLELINERATSKCVNVTFYSDNCCGQNKNKYITTLYMYALKKFENINSITHKYFIKGHTQNENDNAHSLIEKEIQKYLKADMIYTPLQYIPLIKSAKKTGKKFVVTTLTFEDFIDIKGLQSQWGTNFSKDINRNILTWNEIKILKFRKEEWFKFYFKTSYKDEDYREVDVRTRKVLPMLNNIELRKAYNEGFQLSDNKKKDLKTLIMQKVIPPYHSTYYSHLI